MKMNEGKKAAIIRSLESLGYKVQQHDKGYVVEKDGYRICKNVNGECCEYINIKDCEGVLFDEIEMAFENTFAEEERKRCDVMEEIETTH